MDIEQMHREFEYYMAHMSPKHNRGAFSFSCARSSMGKYLDTSLQADFEVWQAAHDHYTKPAAPVVLPPHPDTTRLQHAVWRLEDLLKDDDPQAWKEARKFLERLKKEQWQEAQPQADATTPQGLRECCEHLNAAGHAFWAACAREADGGAVRWVQYADGSLIVFTRGEYKDQILSGMGGLYSAPTKVFEHHSEEFERETQAFEATDKPQADQLDAERYRWLRDQGSLAEGSRHPQSWRCVAMLADMGGEHADTAIDAAIAATKENK